MISYRIVNELPASLSEIAGGKNAGRPFLVLSDRGGRTLSFGEFYARSLGLAGRLESLWIRRGDRLLAVLPNSAEYALLFFACLHLGAAVVPVNPALHPRDIRFILENAAAKLLVHAPETSGLLDGSSIPRWNLPLLDDPLYGESWTPRPGVSRDGILTIVFTSGTTAFPKAVAHKVGSLLGNARLFNQAVGLAPEDRFLQLFSMAYSGGFFNLLISPFLAGASVVMSPGYGPRALLDFWTVPRAHGVNALWLTPTVAAALLMANRDEAGRAWCRENVRKAFIGTAPLHAKLKRDFEAAHGIRLLESYGLSETLLVCTETPGAGSAGGSVGCALPGVELSVRDEAGRELPQGGEGEIFIKTPHMMAGYLDFQKNAPVPADDAGWLASGDIGRLDSGRLSITGRKKDLIIRAGLCVSPMAVESVLLEHPAVAQAAVVGVENALSGEEIVAVIKPKAGVDWARAKADLESFCKTRFAAGSRPAVLLAREEFPVGSTGKVLKKELRAWAAAEASR